jgi:hypothetical protein
VLDRRRLERARRGISDADVYSCSLVALTFLALGRKLLSQLFLFRFFFSFHLFLMCNLCILLFTSRYTRHKSQPQINNRRPSFNIFPSRYLRKSIILKTNASFFNSTEETYVKTKREKEVCKTLSWD